MLKLLATLTKSAKIVIGLIVVDLGVAYFLKILGYSFLETIGDVMLFEVALLFIAAGILDFHSSIGGTQFRKLLFSSKQEYSSSRHKAYQELALPFFLSGLIILLMLVIFAVYTDP